MSKVVIRKNGVNQQQNTVFIGASGGGHTIQNPSGTDMAQEDKLQFTGNVTVTDDSTNGRTVVEVTDSGHTIEDESGTELTQRSTLQFTGNVTVTDDSTNGKTVIEVPDLPDPMVFKGTLGTGGTITVLPAAAAANTGFTYVVIEAGTYDSQSADVGDTFVSNGTAWVLIPSGDELAGHVIFNASGTAMTQRANIQFIGGLKTTDDLSNQRTVIDDTPTEITWTAWNALTPAQREDIPKAHITNVPGANGYITADLLTELWSNSDPTASFAEQNITLNSADYDFLLWIFKNQTSGNDLSVISKKGSGTFLNYSSTNTKCCVALRIVTYNSDTSFSVGNASWSLDNATPTTDNARCVPVVIYGIKKTLELTFDAIASDVSTSANKCMLSDGVTSVGDVIDKGYVEVVGNSSKTYKTLFNELFALVDKDKINYKSVMAFNDASFFNMQRITITNDTLTRLSFIHQEFGNGNGNSLYYNGAILESSDSRYKGSYLAQTGAYTFSDDSNNTVANGTVIRIYY